jgi:hypothetical protein
MPVIFDVSYLFTGLARCSMNPEISFGARKLARTPQIKKNKNKRVIAICF